MTGKNTLLYYPTVSVPEDWAKTAILYWDSIGSLIPAGWDEASREDETLHFAAFPVGSLSQEDISFLEESGLFHSLDPASVLGQGTGREGLRDDFFGIYNSDAMQREIEEAQKRFVAATGYRGMVSRLWLSGKESFDEVLHFLVRDNLAAHAEREDAFWIETSIASLYFSLMAWHVAKTNPGMHCGTDEFYNVARLHEPRLYRKNVYALHLLLNNCIPAPSRDTPLASVLSFRDKYADELSRFQDTVRSICTTFSGICDLAGVPGEVSASAKILEKEKNILLSCFKKAKIPCRERSLQTVCMMSQGLRKELDDYSTPDTYGLSLAAQGPLHLLYNSIEEREGDGQTGSFVYQAEKTGIIEI